MPENKYIELLEAEDIELQVQVMAKLLNRKYMGKQ